MRVGLVVLVGASLWASYREIVLKPFPFFDVEYVSSAEWDEEPKGFFKIPLSGKKSQDLEIVLKKISEFDSLDLKLQYASSVARKAMHDSTGHLLRTKPEDVLSASSSHKNICSESSKIFAVLMQLSNIPSRVVWMNGHTVAEIWDTKKWILVDAYWNVRAFGENGLPLGVREVIHNFPSVTFAKVVKDSAINSLLHSDIDYTSSVENVYQKQSLLLIVEGGDLFSIHNMKHDFVGIALSLVDFNGSSVGNARQLVLNDNYVGNFGVKLLKRLAPYFN